VILNFTGAPYTPPNGGALTMDLASGGVVGPPPPPGKPDFSPTIVNRWGRGRLQLRTAVPAFVSGKRTQRAAAATLPHGNSRGQGSLYGLAVQDLVFQASAAGTRWGGLVLDLHHYGQGWRVPEYRANAYAVDWADLELQVSVCQSGWRAPHLRVDAKSADWAGNALVVDQWHAAWTVPAAVRQNGLPLRWGTRWVPPYCEYNYIPETDAPGGALVLRLKSPSHVPPSGGALTMEFRLTDQPVHCYDGYQSGPKFGNPPVPPVIKVTRRPYELEVYHMPASITLTRLSDGATINVLRASVSIDIDSWAWSMRADLASSADLALVAPIGATLQDVELTINGHVWRFTVESQSRGRRFNQSTFSISGRSRSAALALPYAETLTYTETSAKTAQQLALDALQFTGWTLDWQIPDWLVAANSLSVSEKTPIDIVNQIASAAGAVVQTDPSAMVLHVISRYPIAPWGWSAAIPDIALPDLVLKTADSNWQPGPPFNRIFVSGEHAGVNLDLTRDGTAGDKVAPMVVDRLLTEVTANRERGRVELSKSGKKSVETMDIPLAVPPDEPALILPGSLVQVEEATTWKGLAISVSIEASNSSAVTVNQKITVERAY
jgi:hypothetical protein